MHLLSAGAGVQASQHTGTRPNDLSRTSIVVPLLVNTFSLSSVVSAFFPCKLSTDSASLDACNPSVPVLPASVLDQAFVVGPGFSPIPAKLKAQISTGKYINLGELMVANFLQVNRSPELFFEGIVVLTSGANRRHNWRD